MENYLHAIILSIFPEIFPGPLAFSLAGKALKKNIWSYEVINIRDFGITKHKTVDDIPYGGSTGLVMRPDVLGNAIEYSKKKISNNKTKNIYYFSPKGTVINQNIISKLISQKNIILLCGRFEGIDQRIIDEYNITEISLGNFVLSGGEIAAIALLDACVRLLPGVISNKESLQEESFSIGSECLLEYPLYTRPRNWKNRSVPKVLISGDHEKIKQWRKQESIRITKDRKPDLLKNF